MHLPHPATVFGRHEFIIRRLHSLTGLIPIGGYLCFHLATNAALLDGPQTYQHRADQIHVLGPTTLLFLEWGLIFLPILFHGVVGTIIVTRGKRNVTRYPYGGNWRYTLQRATGVIAFAFILWHVFHMHGWFRFEWWREYIAKPLGGAQFDPRNAPLTATRAIQASPVVGLLYAVGVTAAVYHFANGLWTIGITWGVWTSPRAQRRIGYPCAAFGVALGVMGLATIVKMETADFESDLQPQVQHGQTIAAFEREMEGVCKKERGERGEMESEVTIWPLKRCATRGKTEKGENLRL
jgi:succinate dehydrogenase / fumarate reductase cytochrome b subunit